MITLGVSDLEESVRFYEPELSKPVRKNTRTQANT